MLLFYPILSVYENVIYVSYAYRALLLKPLCVVESGLSKAMMIMVMHFFRIAEPLWGEFTGHRYIPFAND